MQASRARYPDSYVVMDLETSGLSVTDDQIIEVAAIRVIQGVPEASFERLIRFDGALPDAIVQLTGITDELLQAQGVDRAAALRDMIAFIDDLPVISHNAAFDVGFLRTACRLDALPMPRSRIIDTLDMSRRAMKKLPDYKLQTVAHILGISTPTTHRALADCRTLQQVYVKLNEKS